MTNVNSLGSNFVQGEGLPRGDLVALVVDRRAVATGTSIGRMREESVVAQVHARQTVHPFL